ncbi:hypothetical protein BGZ98_008792 [Dissophora globulifera]|nr:hypothetical protein BGZ98_008792 [Dissophora globulifera]
MLPFFVLLLSGVVAFQTKPKQDTFAPFIISQRKARIGASGSNSASSGAGGASAAGQGISGWLSRNILEPLTGGPRVPDYTISDYYLFTIATLNDGSGQYLGLFQQWWTLSELQEVDSSGASLGGSGSSGSRSGNGNGNVLEAQAEGRKQEAVQAKIRKDYHGAARAYVDAAKLFEKSGTEFNLMEAAGAYEDAFKSYQMAKQTGPAIQCLENAARLFRTHARGGSRAAKIYNQLGDLYKNQDARKALEMYREASELYQSESDGRALHATIRQAEQMCILHDYEKAFLLYKDTIIPETMSQDILQYTTRDHIVNAVIAHLGATSGDWIVLERDVEHFEEICHDFRTSRGDAVLKSLARAEREHDARAFQDACVEFDRLRTGGMADWQVGLLLEEKKKLEDGSLL